MAEVLLEVLGAAGSVGSTPHIDTSFLERMALIDAGFTMVYIMYGISDHSTTESRAFRTRVLILDLLRSKAEWL